MAQLEGDLEDAMQEYQKHESYLSELKKLAHKEVSGLSEISQAQAKTHQLKRMYDIAQKKYDSYKNFVVPSQIEKAKSNSLRAEMELSQIKRSSLFKVARATAAVEKAKRELETAEAKLRKIQHVLEKTIIRAPFPGIAVLFESYRGNEKRLPRIGDTVWQNQPILYLPDISSFIVKTKIREIDLYKVRKNQKVTIRIDAFPKEGFTGKVVFIGALAEKSPELGREKYFQLTVSVDDTQIPLKPGMTARVSILSKRIKNELSVPIQSIFSDSDSKFCYKFNDGGFQKTPVKIQDQNEDFVTIKAGLDEGDRVSLAAPDDA